MDQATPTQGTPLPPPTGGVSSITQHVANVRRKFSWAKLKQRMKDDPLVFVFLGATVFALTRGMGAMLRNDKRQSQKMMRMRVAFQLSTVGALVGGIYWRAFKSMQGDEAATKFLQRSAQPSSPSADNRVFMRDPAKFDLSPEELQAREEAAARGETDASTVSSDAAAAGGASRTRALA